MGNRSAHFPIKVIFSMQLQYNVLCDIVETGFGDFGLTTCRETIVETINYMLKQMTMIVNLDHFMIIQFVCLE
jgi:hypothetical protein